MATALAHPEPVQSVQHRNEVHLVGRFSGPVVLHRLPSGTEMTTWQVVVDRIGDSIPEPRRAMSDTIDCATADVKIRRLIERLQQSDVISMTGALRRRFWREQFGTRSRYQVEVARAAFIERPVAAPAR